MTNDNTAVPQQTALATAEYVYKNAQPASLDTVVLYIEDEFEIDPHSRLRRVAPGRRVSKANKEDKKCGIYRPTIMTDKYWVEGNLYCADTLKIQFSVPKLVHGNNLIPVTKANLPIIWENLMAELKHAGIIIKLETLREAYLRRMDIGKNFGLLNDANLTKMMFEIARSVKRFPKSDIGDLSYENGGQGIKIFNTAETWQIYDKVKDFERSFGCAKRAFDKEHYPQKELMQTLQKQNAKILRMESQFNNYTKIRKAIGHEEKVHFTLEYVLFNVDLDQVLFQRWQTLINTYSKFPFDSSESEIVLGLNGADKPSALRAFAVLGWCQYSNHVGRETLRTMLEPLISKRQMDYFLNAMKAEVRPIAKTSDCITFINKHFEAFGVNTGDKNK
jgi:hypothetical protein